MAKHGSKVHNKTQFKELVTLYQALQERHAEGNEVWGEPGYADDNAGRPSFLSSVPGKDYGPAYLGLITGVLNFPGVSEKLPRGGWVYEKGKLEKEVRERVLNHVQKNGHVKM